MNVKNAAAPATLLFDDDCKPHLAGWLRGNPVYVGTEGEWRRMWAEAVKRHTKQISPPAERNAPVSFPEAIRIKPARHFMPGIPGVSETNAGGDFKL